jgi:hypothetical protein
MSKLPQQVAVEQQVALEYPPEPVNLDFWVMVQEGKFDVLFAVDELPLN